MVEINNYDLLKVDKDDYYLYFNSNTLQAYINAYYNNDLDSLEKDKIYLKEGETKLKCFDNNDIYILRDEDISNFLIESNDKRNALLDEEEQKKQFMEVADKYDKYNNLNPQSYTELTVSFDYNGSKVEEVINLGRPIETEAVSPTFHELDKIEEIKNNPFFSQLIWNDEANTLNIVQEVETEDRYYNIGNLCFKEEDVNNILAKYNVDVYDNGRDLPPASPGGCTVKEEYKDEYRDEKPLMLNF